VAFAEGGDGEELAEGIAGHGIWTSKGSHYSLPQCSNPCVLADDVGPFARQQPENDVVDPFAMKP